MCTIAESALSAQAVTVRIAVRARPQSVTVCGRKEYFTPRPICIARLTGVRKVLLAQEHAADFYLSSLPQGGGAGRWQRNCGSARGTGAYAIYGATRQSEGWFGGN